MVAVLRHVAAATALWLAITRTVDVVDADDTANATPSPSPSPSPSSSPVANPAMAVDTWETGDLTPSSKLFQQTTAIQSMCAPRNINVRGATTSTSYGRPIPTNAWWSNLLACTPASSNSTNPIWSNPFALTLETGRDGDGLFGISMSYAYRNRFFGGTSGNGDSVKFYGHAIWAEALFSASAFKKTKPSFELADWSDLGVHTVVAIPAPAGSPRTPQLESYLVNGMAYRPKSPDMDIVGFADADLGGDPDTRQSTSGIVLQCGGATIAYQSKLQTTVVDDSCSAELVAAARCGDLMRWCLNLLNELQVTIGSSTFFWDNKGAIQVIANKCNHHQIKCLDLTVYKVKDYVAQGHIEVKFCPTADMPADMLTKNVAKIKLAKHRSALGVVNIQDVWNQGSVEECQPVNLDEKDQGSLHPDIHWYIPENGEK